MTAVIMTHDGLYNSFTKVANLHCAKLRDLEQIFEQNLGEIE